MKFYHIQNLYEADVLEILMKKGPLRNAHHKYIYTGKLVHIFRIVWYDNTRKDFKIENQGRNSFV